jgi:hypothetical protein
MKFLNTLFFIIFINACLIAQDKPLSIVTPVRVLYINCVNDLQVLIPNLRAEDKISYEVEGAQLIKGKSTTEIKLIPSDTLVELKVFKNSILYKKNEFKAMRIPLPKMNVFVNDSLVDFQKGVRASSIKKIQLKLIPDEWVAKNLPDEVQYRIVEFKILLSRGRSGVFSKIIKGDTIESPFFSGKLMPDDRFIIEVKSFNKMNYQKVEEEVPYNKVSVFFLF